MRIAKYKEFVMRWEGSMGRDTVDSSSKYPCPTPFNGKTGWHTVKGVTYAAWVRVFGKNNDARFFAMNDDDWFNVFKTSFWSKVRCSEFSNFSISVLVCEIAWVCGVGQAPKSLQRAIKNCGKDIIVDGIIGNTTIRLANDIDPVVLFDAIQAERERFFRSISKGKNVKFLKGWLNRVNDATKNFRP